LIGFLARALFTAGTCVFLEIWTGKKISFLPVPVSLVNIAKNGEKMQGNAREPFGVTREAVDAYERQTGFHGRGKSMVEHSVRVIVPSQGVVQPTRRPVERRSGGNSGQRLNHSVTFFRNRANPATARQGGAA